MFESENSGDDAPIVVTQRTPVCSEKIGNHEGEALSLRFWSYILARAAPIYLALVVLVKGRFVVGDEDISKLRFAAAVPQRYRSSAAAVPVVL